MMKRFGPTILSLAALFLVACPLLAQEAGSTNSDAIQAQIRTVEAMSIQGKSRVVQEAHKRTLLNLYKQLETALVADLDDLRQLQRATGSAGTRDEKIEADIRKITDTRDRVVAMVQQLTRGGTETAATAVTTGDRGSTSRIVDSPNTAPPSIVTAGSNGDNGNKSESASSDSAAVDTPTSSASTASPPTPAGSSATQPGSQGNRQSTSLNASLNQALQAKIEQRETTKQTETPSISGNSSSLVDTGSAGDLVNLGLNLAGLTGGAQDNSNKANSLSVTTSAYALYAAFNGVDPLNPGFYNRNKFWRRFSFTLGYDDESISGTNTNEQARIFGTKFLIVNKREPGAARNDKYFRIIERSLQTRTAAFGDLFEKVTYHVLTIKSFRDKVLIPQFRAYLQVKRQDAVRTPSATDTNQLARIDNLIARVNNDEVFMLDPNGIQPRSTVLADARVSELTPSGAWKKEEADFWEQIGRDYLGENFREKLEAAAGKAVLDDIDAFVEGQLSDAKVFESLQQSSAVLDAIQNIRRAPQFSVYFLTKQRPQGIDEYTGEAIFDYGLANRVNLTLNGNYLYKNSPVIGGDTRGGKFAGQFRFQLTPEKLVGRNPLFFFVSGDGEGLSGRKPTFHAQAKLSIPILNGLDLPLALTYANRNEQNKKDFVKFQFSFALDTARILQALTAK